MKTFLEAHHLILMLILNEFVGTFADAIHNHSVCVCVRVRVRVCVCLLFTHKQDMSDIQITSI